jgi:hypothetical protein
MPEFRTGRSDIDAAEMDVTRASAVEDDAEEISISLRAMPLVEALVHTFETARVVHAGQCIAPGSLGLQPRSASHSRGRSSRRHRATVHRDPRRSAARGLDRRAMINALVN